MTKRTLRRLGLLLTVSLFVFSASQVAFGATPRPCFSWIFVKAEWEKATGCWGSSAEDDILIGWHVTTQMIEGEGLDSSVFFSGRELIAEFTILPYRNGSNEAQLEPDDRIVRVTPHQEEIHFSVDGASFPVDANGTRLKVQAKMFIPGAFVSELPDDDPVVHGTLTVRDARSGEVVCSGTTPNISLNRSLN
ncbi:MAG: hypothetical protein AB1540_03545 [Bdellovibrionota bacterium]